MDQRLSVITLGVSDLAAARAFYGQGLGWREVEPRQEAIAFFQLPGFVLALWPADSLAEDAGLEPSPGGFGRVTLAINQRTRDAVDAALDEAVRAGARLLKPAAETFWGGYSGYFADPDGQPWEVAQNPYCVIREDGATVFGEAAQTEG